MSWVGASLGVMLGFSLRMYANALQKLRLFRRPWEHLLLGSIVGVMGYHWDDWRWELRRVLNEQRVSRGLPPIRFRGELEGSDIMEAADVIRQVDATKDIAKDSVIKSNSG